MSVNQSPDTIPLQTPRFLRQSHRTLPEQAVGLGIYLLICLGFEWLCGLARPFYGPIPNTLYATLSTAYYLSLALSMWTLWRSYSLRVLKLELSIFLGQFLFQMVWAAGFFVLHEMLLALVALLFLWSNTLLAGLLFWRKERLSGSLLILPLFWVFYLVGLNMVMCISKP